MELVRLNSLLGAGVVDPAGADVVVLFVEEPNRLVPDVLFRLNNEPP